MPKIGLHTSGWNCLRPLRTPLEIRVTAKMGMVSLSYAASGRPASCGYGHDCVFPFQCPVELSRFLTCPHWPLSLHPGRKTLENQNGQNDISTSWFGIPPPPPGSFPPNQHAIFLGISLTSAWLYDYTCWREEKEWRFLLWMVVRTLLFRGEGRLGVRGRHGVDRHCVGMFVCDRART